MIGERERSIPLSCEGGIKQKADLRFRPRFRRLARQLQCGPQVKISPRRIWIGVYASPQPLYRLVVLFQREPTCSEAVSRAGWQFGIRNGNV
jgi:hypothetical protein